MEKDRYSAPPKMNFASLEKTGLWLYVLIMAIFFGMQALSSVESYLGKKIVEDVDIEPRQRVSLPSITICPFPGYKRVLSGDFITNIDNYCDKNVTEISKECIEENMFQQDDVIVPMALLYPLMKPENLSGHVSLSSMNLGLGTCFTYEDDQEREFSALTSIIFGLRKYEAIWSFVVMVHDHGKFMPLLGLGAEYTGQFFISVDDPIYSTKQLEVEVTQVRHLNTDKFPCNEDGEYNLAQCIEDYVYETVGCKSPWDRFPASDPKAKECRSRGELEALRDQHVTLYNMNSVRFRELTKCLQPCVHQKYSYITRLMKQESFLQPFGVPNITGFAFSLYSTDKKTITQRYLYELPNLVGEVGGSMGLFLGASLVTFYEAFVAGVRRVARWLITK